MYQALRFAIDNIYCAPGQDRQFSLKLVRINKPTLPAKRKIDAYNAVKYLPNQTEFFQVFAIGNLPPMLLNLLAPDHQWYKDTWIKVSDDMKLRDYIFHLYSTDGVMYPRDNIYYSFIDEKSLLVAVEVTSDIRGRFDSTSFEYMHVYSNAWFASPEYGSSSAKVGIDYKLYRPANNSEKVSIQNYITTIKNNGGDVFIYVDGWYTDNMNLNIPDFSFVEVIYDQSIRKKEVFDISELRTFDSVKDDRLKYLLFRQKETNFIEFNDDTELYVRNKDALVTKGLFFYKHKTFSMRNVTDKDFSVPSAYINTTAQRVADKTGGGVSDKTIVLYSRHSGREIDLKYSSMKLHELYKLPQDVQHDVLSNTNYTVDILRAEALENSAYFDIATSSKLRDVTLTKAVQAVGYNGLSYYFAMTPLATDAMTVDVPELYQAPSTVLEYDSSGKYVNKATTTGPHYIKSDASIGFVEFVYGQTPSSFGRLYDKDETFTLRHDEFRIFSAYFENTVKQSNWEEITNNASKVTRAGDTITLNETLGRKVRVVYANEPNIYADQISLGSGAMRFALRFNEDRGEGPQAYIADLPPKNLEIILNGHELTQGLDYFLDFPYVSICNKKYLNYSLGQQQLQIRMYGVELDKTKINSRDVRGFVNNGTLTRNSYYDIRDDRVYSVFIDGKIYDRNQVRYSETDNVVRIDHPKNGLPYVLKENFIPLMSVSGQDTESLYTQNATNDKKISDLFNLTFPEPDIDEFNVILTPHYIFSPTVSKIINDVISGVIPSSVYSTPYDDSVILELLDNQYKDLFKLDPIKFSMPNILVEIHPHLGNSVVSLNLLQYRFVANVVRFITNNNPSKINLSGYLAVST